MKQTLGYEDNIQDLIKSFRFTVVSLSIVIILMLMLFAGVLSYMVLVQVPEVVHAALADYFSDFEVIP